MPTRRAVLARDVAMAKAARPIIARTMREEGAAVAAAVEDAESPAVAKVLAGEAVTAARWERALTSIWLGLFDVAAQDVADEFDLETIDLPAEQVAELNRIVKERAGQIAATNRRLIVEGIGELE